MMFSMMAIPMSDYISSDNIPDSGDGGFDFDIGF
jgi:hypothetical protein